MSSYFLSEYEKGLSREIAECLTRPLVVTEGNVQLTARIRQLPDPIDSDTIVTAGSILTIDDTGNPFKTGANKLSIGIGTSISSKWKIHTVFYPTSSTSAIQYISTLDRSVSAGADGGARVETLSDNYKVRFTNSDTVDITIKFISVAEVY